MYKLLMPGLFRVHFTTGNYGPKLVYLPLLSIFWKGVRVVEGTGLENQRAGNGTEGSNPSPSAN